MDDHEWLAGHFERHRPHLRAVAYRMLGSLSEADDAVQDTWLRLSRAGADDVENLGGWLMSFTVADGKITRIDTIADPDRVRRFAASG